MAGPTMLTMARVSPLLTTGPPDDAGREGSMA